jgi:choice-of-anchor C domain-containing protein
MKRSTWMLAAAVALFCITPAWASPVNLLVNGSFEDGSYDQTQPSFNTLDTGSTAITGWTVTGGSIDWIGSYWQPANDGGSKSLDMNGLVPGTIEQIFSTVSGQSYHVSFDISGNPAGGPDVKTLVSIASPGGSSNTFSFDITAQGKNSLGDMKWQTKTFDFQATSASTTISFQSTTSGLSGNDTYPQAFGPALDNVVVSVPLPAAVWTGLPVMGLMAVVAIRRRQPVEV